MLLPMESDSAELHSEVSVYTEMLPSGVPGCVSFYQVNKQIFLLLSDILNDAKCGKINIEEINENTIKVVVEDRGHGIEDISMAMQPLYTSKPELERSGMGFTVMESFMDDITVSSIKDEGTKVVMTKKNKLA